MSIAARMEGLLVESGTFDDSIRAVLDKWVQKNVAAKIANALKSMGLTLTNDSDGGGYPQIFRYKVTSAAGTSKPGFVTFSVDIVEGGDGYHVAVSMWGEYASGIEIDGSAGSFKKAAEVAKSEFDRAQK